MNQLRSKAALLCSFLAIMSPTRAADLLVDEQPPTTSLRLSTGATIRATTQPVSNAQLVTVPNSSVHIITWTEGGSSSFYAVSLDGQTVHTVRNANYNLALKYAEFDPSAGAPTIPASLTAGTQNRLHIVQFKAQPVLAMRSGVSALGGTIRAVLHHNALLVEMTDTVKIQVAALSYVRAVAPFHPAYRLERNLADAIASGTPALPQQRYIVMVFDESMPSKATVANAVVGIGGEVDGYSGGDPFLFAILTAEQITTLVGLNEVQYIGVWSAGEPDMDYVREIQGVNYAQFTGGYGGRGVRGEVLESGGRPLDHMAFHHHIPIGHTVVAADPAYHATNVFGILFGDGSGDLSDQHSDARLGTGMLPEAQGLWASAEQFAPSAGYSRKCHACELTCADLSDCTARCTTPCTGSASNHTPTGPYWASFQNNSWGSALKLTYELESYQIDDIVFEYDLLHCQSQSNCGAGGCGCTNYIPDRPKCSRPEAWAKNNISVGTYFHDNDLSYANDTWVFPSGVNLNQGSRGPASDGRVKPDLINAGYWVMTPSTPDDQGCESPCTFECPAPGTCCPVDPQPCCNPPNDPLDCLSPCSCCAEHPELCPGFDTYYRRQFRGTSAATPITCGHVGLLYEMWNDRIFGNSIVDAFCNANEEYCVFKNRPHAATVKAMLINTARQFDFVDPSAPNPDLTRNEQGWGVPNAGKVYALAQRKGFLLIDNETNPLTELAHKTYNVTVPSGATALKITIVFTDPPGTTNSTKHAINDLSVSAVYQANPTSYSYQGNHGLMTNIWSPPAPFGTDADHFNTVENIFVKNPPAGAWTIDVFANDIQADAHVETSDVVDADFALVVTLDFDCNGSEPHDIAAIGEGYLVANDCNANGVPDSCPSESSLDGDGNGIFDVCDQKTRFISLDLGSLNGEQALRVRLDSLHHVVPPYSGGPSIPMTAFEGQIRWIGPPDQYTETSQAPGFVFTAARLQCAPYYADWSDLGVFHVTGVEIVPSSKYTIEAVNQSCEGFEEECVEVVRLASARTTRWGDVEAPHNPPSSTVQPDVTDIGALVNKFRGAPGAPSKARALLAGYPGNAFGEITPAVLNVDLGFQSISACVDAFRGVPYPYNIAACP